MFKVNQIVFFGRPNGEKTQGRILKVNNKSILIETAEARGSKNAGQKWRVHPSLVTAVDGPAAPAAAAPAPAPNLTPGGHAERALLAAYMSLEDALEPENLHCDGERPAAEARCLAAKYRSEMAEIVRQLGRTPTTAELNRLREERMADFRNWRG